MIKSNNMKKREGGLSLIESTMVLSISAAVISGALYFYNQVQENRKLEEGIKQIQTIAATVNKLYSNSVYPMKEVNDVVKAISVTSGIPTTTAIFEGKPETVFTSPTGVYVKFGWMTNSQEKKVYTLKTYTESVSSCMSYATLNLGTLMASKTRISQEDESPNSLEKPYFLTPAKASTQCRNAYSSGKPITITYALLY